MNLVPSHHRRAGVCVLVAAVVVAAGAALPSATCPRLAGRADWERLAWSLVGPWLATALSLVPDRDATLPVALLPALALLSSLCGALFMPNLHGALTLALFANVLVLGAAGRGRRRYHVRLVAGCVGGASLAALHASALACWPGWHVR
jgi:hypothetical protein